MPFDALYTSRQLPDRDGETMFLKFCTPVSIPTTKHSSESGQHTQRGEEPSILSAGVSLLQHLLNRLLRVLPLADLLEGIVGDSALEALELERVSRGHQVVVVDHLDEGLDLGALVLARLGHAAGDLGGVSLNAGDERMAERMRLVAIVDGLDDDDLLIATSQSSSASPALAETLVAPPEPICLPKSRRDAPRGRRGILRSWISYLLAGVSAAGDDGDSADLEELHLGEVGLVWRVERCRRRGP